MKIQPLCLARLFSFTAWAFLGFALGVVVCVACSPANSQPMAAAAPEPPALVGSFAHGEGTAFVHGFRLVSVYRDLNDPSRYVVSIDDGTTAVQFTEDARTTIVIGMKAP